MIVGAQMLAVQPATPAISSEEVNRVPTVQVLSACWVRLWRRPKTAIRCMSAFSHSTSLRASRFRMLAASSNVPVAARSIMRNRSWTIFCDFDGCIANTMIAKVAIRIRANSARGDMTFLSP